MIKIYFIQLINCDFNRETYIVTRKVKIFYSFYQYLSLLPFIIIKIIPFRRISKKEYNYTTKDHLIP